MADQGLCNLNDFGLSLRSNWLHRLVERFLSVSQVNCQRKSDGRKTGRIMSWNDPFGQTGFLTQIVCLTLAPAFFGAGIYLCISKM